MLKKLLYAIVTLFLLSLSTGTTFAHEPREIDDYNLVVGFLNEPAFEGLMNGVYVYVGKVGAHGHGEEEAAKEHGHGEELITGVTGLQNTLQVEVTHVPSGSTRLMRLHAFSDETGHYKSDFIPTSTGQFIFHLIGTIEGKPIDEQFVSGVGTFDDVQPATTIQFPESAASPRELESAVRGALASAQQAQDTALAVEAATDSARESASTATTLAIAGIVVGALGIAVGGIGMFAALRRRS